MNARRQLGVLVADDEPMVRAGLRAILMSDPAIEVVAEAGDGESALAVARSSPVDVLVLDIRMPFMSGLDVLRALRADGRPARSVLVTTFGEDDYVAEALALDADAFVLKSGDPRELVLAVHAVATGGAFFSPAIARRLLGRPLGTDTSRVWDARRRFSALTPREQEILRLVGLGRSNPEIAAELFLAAGTVKTHMTSILRTTGARNRVEAALVAVHAHEA